MDTVWSAPKQEYNDAIANMELRREGLTMRNQDRDEALSLFTKMVWAFQMIVARQLSNLGDEAAFQAKLYKNIDPETVNKTIAATHRPNCAMHNIRTWSIIFPYILKEGMRLIRIS